MVLSDDWSKSKSHHVINKVSLLFQMPFPIRLRALSNAGSNLSHASNDVEIQSQYDETDQDELFPSFIATQNEEQVESSSFLAFIGEITLFRWYLIVNIIVEMGIIYNLEA
eukprot:34776_1